MIKKYAKGKVVSQDYNVNSEISVETVRLVDADGEMVGVVSISEAIEMAEEVGLDLVEISPMAVPPVCKILDFGKFRFDLRKKEKDNQKKNKASRVELKELWLRPVTDKHDIGIKVKHAKEFLEDGNKVKFTVKFRGRELARMEQGAEILESVLEFLGPVVIDQAIKKNGRNMTMVVAPEK